MTLGCLALSLEPALFAIAATRANTVAEKIAANITAWRHGEGP